MKFYKLQGTGNDFIIIDGRGIKRDWSRLARKLCDRHFGIGADGLIVILPSKKADLRMRIFNYDGSEAETCGNGLRCFAKYAIEHQLVDGPGLTVETLAGVNYLMAHRRKGNVTRVTVGMGAPVFEPSAIPVNVGPSGSTSVPVLDYKLDVCGHTLYLTFVSMGNPHAVAFINEVVSDFPLATVGPCVETHPIFPKRTNFEVARVINNRSVETRVWERGVGETLA
ncbi:MAG: diaminopimelate epimerase, partial [Dehalococcoidia bacterium]|nr:diaminopimelate epimerase [Dehalococcoidia bacterium]